MERRANVQGGRRSTTARSRQGGTGRKIALGVNKTNAEGGAWTHRLGVGGWVGGDGVCVCMCVCVGGGGDGDGEGAHLARLVLPDVNLLQVQRVSVRVLVHLAAVTARRLRWLG